MMPLAVTTFPLPAFLSANVDVPATVRESPLTRLSVNVTVAVFVASYCLLSATIPIARAFAVMFAVVVAVVFCV